MRLTQVLAGPISEEDFYQRVNLLAERMRLMRGRDSVDKDELILSDPDRLGSNVSWRAVVGLPELYIRSTRRGA
jgi:hypothetical protein